MMDARLADCPAGVRRQLGSFVCRIREILDDNLRGAYVHGSLALGGFNPNRSDIDLLILTGQPLSLERKRMLAEMMLEMSGRPRPLEASILHTRQFDPWRHPTAYDFHFGEDSREQVERDLRTGVWKTWNDNENVDRDLAAHLTVTRMCGLCLDGQPITDILPIVPPADFRDSILSDMRWARERAMQLPVYGILNACRVSAFVEEEAVLSKAAGAQWALSRFPVRYHGLIADALKAYRAEGNPQFREAEVLDFLDFLEATVARPEDRNDRTIEPGATTAGMNAWGQSIS